MEILIVIAVFGYIYYLRNYADLRTRSEKEEANLKEGIQLYLNHQIQPAFTYFDQRIKERPNSSVAYLYRARCFKEMGNFNSAMDDLNTGLSYDESVFGLHLEKGKLQFRNGMYEPALKSLNKAVFNAGDTDPESYYWRGMTKQHLHMEVDAQKDFEKEAEIREIYKYNGSTNKVIEKPFLDRRLIANSVLVIFTSAALIYIIKNAESIHLPYLMAVFSAISIGFVEPHKGWILALMQGIFILAGYYLFTAIPENGGKKELENFSLYGSVILTFMGSFLGAFLKRALSQ